MDRELIIPCEKDAEDLERFFSSLSASYKGAQGLVNPDIDRLKKMTDELYRISFRLARYYARTGDKSSEKKWTDSLDLFYETGMKLHASALELQPRRKR